MKRRSFVKAGVFFCFFISLRLNNPRGAVSSAGRASRLHREGRRFDPVTAHHSLDMLSASSAYLYFKTWLCFKEYTFCCGLDKILLLGFIVSLTEEEQNRKPQRLY